MISISYYTILYYTMLLCNILIVRLISDNILIKFGKIENLT